MNVDFGTPATEGQSAIDSSNSFLNQSATKHEPRVRPEPLFTRQTLAPLQLMIVSQPWGVRVPQLTSYDYPTRAGLGITVYVLDSGANLANPVSDFFFLGIRYHV